MGPRLRRGLTCSIKGATSRGREVVGSSSLGNNILGTGCKHEYCQWMSRPPRLPRTLPGLPMPPRGYFYNLTYHVLPCFQFPGGVPESTGHIIFTVVNFQALAVNPTRRCKHSGHPGFRQAVVRGESGHADSGDTHRRHIAGSPIGGCACVTPRVGCNHRSHVTKTLATASQFCWLSVPKAWVPPSH
jgi:hypothetical protein